MKISTYVAIILLFIVAIYYGEWGGQILTESSSDKGSNAIFQLLLSFFAVYYSYLYKIKLRFPLKTIAYSYMVLIFFLSFTRHNISEDLRFFTSIVLTQIIILFISHLLHKESFAKSLFILVFYFIIILWICAFVHLNSVGIISFEERNSLNRLGGLYFYGVTGTIAGLTALLSGIGFYIERSKLKKTLYSIFAINGLLFTIASDLRNAMAASACCLILLLYQLSKRSLRMKMAFYSSIIVLLVIGTYYIQHSEAVANTDDDLGTREMIWAWSLDGISRKPLTGYGKENYFATNVKSMIFQEKLSDPHSSLLNLMIMLGIPAALLFIFYYSKLTIYNYKNDRIFQGVLIVIPLYWILSTITGGAFFIGYGYFGSYVFGLSIFGILLHPQLFISRKPNLIRNIDISSSH